MDLATRCCDFHSCVYRLLGGLFSVAGNGEETLDIFKERKIRL